MDTGFALLYVSVGFLCGCCYWMVVSHVLSHRERKEKKPQATYHGLEEAEQIVEDLLRKE